MAKKIVGFFSGEELEQMGGTKKLCNQPSSLYLGNSEDILKTFPDNSVDSIVTDPPYGLRFMGKRWDYDVPSVGLWSEVFRVLKPGGHLLSFGGTRTYHRMVVNIEDAGFEIRDTLMWVYGSGFPKSLDVSKAIDKIGGESRSWFIDYCIKIATERGISKKQLTELFPSKNGKTTGWLYNKASHNQSLTVDQFNKLRDFLDLPFADMKSAEREIVGEKTSGLGSGKTYAFSDRNIDAQKNVDITAPATPEAKQWEGWGTALKPAYEPIIMARKPIEGTVAENVLKWGTGGINVDGCRVEVDPAVDDMLRTVTRKPRESQTWENGSGFKNENNPRTGVPPSGRFPANFIHDGSDEVVGLFPNSKSTGGINGGKLGKRIYGKFENKVIGSNAGGLGDSGSAARFFYCAKASRAERGEGNNHPTVKPLKLMEYLVRLVTPPGGVVLDPFMGSGTTGLACRNQGFGFIGIERDAASFEIAKRRIEGS